MSFIYVLAFFTVLTVCAGAIPMALASEAVPSPRVQLESGVAPEDIVCRDGNVLAIRDNGNHVCVKPLSVDVMGWHLADRIIVNSTFYDYDELGISIKQHNVNIVESKNMQTLQKQSNAKENSILYGQSPVVYETTGILTLEKPPRLKETVNFEIVFSPTQSYFDKNKELIDYATVFPEFRDDYQFHFQVSYDDRLEVTVDGVPKENTLVIPTDHHYSKYFFKIPDTDFDDRLNLFSDMNSAYTLTGTITPLEEGDYHFYFDGWGDGFGLSGDGVSFHVDKEHSFFSEEYLHRQYNGHVLPEIIRGASFDIEELEEMHLSGRKMTNDHKIEDWKWPGVDARDREEFLDRYKQYLQKIPLHRDALTKDGILPDFDRMSDNELAEYKWPTIPDKYRLLDAKNIKQSIENDPSSKYSAVPVYLEMFFDLDKDATLKTKVPHTLKVGQTVTAKITAESAGKQTGYVLYDAYVGPGLEFTNKHKEKGTKYIKNHVGILQEGVGTLEYEITATELGTWFLKDRLNNSDDFNRYSIKVVR